MHTEAVHREFPLPALIEAVAGRPADVFGLAGRKGRLNVGYDADFVVFDPAEVWRFDATDSFSSASHSPFEGRELLGRVRDTYVRGRPVYRAGELLAEPGYGRWLRRGEINAPALPG